MSPIMGYICGEASTLQAEAEAAGSRVIQSHTENRFIEHTAVGASFWDFDEPQTATHLERPLGLIQYDEIYCIRNSE